MNNTTIYIMAAEDCSGVRQDMKSDGCPKRMHRLETNVPAN